MTELGNFGDYRGVFVEITRMDHGHGGPGWEFGTCLWSPTKNRADADRYSLMREPARGDLVLHFLRDQWPDGIDTRLCGSSKVARPAQEVRQPPPTPGDWGGFDAYYRIDLERFDRFPSPVPLRTLVDEYGDSIRRELVGSNPRFYPFTTHGDAIRTVQGIYLARCTQELFDVFRAALGIEEAGPAADAPAAQRSYAEGRRMAAERLFFARNPRLAAAAKAHHGTACMVCGFDFGHAYGELGAGYIEAHHLDPLSERDPAEWTAEVTTSVEQVAVVCANCHRMIHRKRPALTLDELRNHRHRADLARSSASQ